MGKFHFVAPLMENRKMFSLENRKFFPALSKPVPPGLGCSIVALAARYESTAETTTTDAEAEAEAMVVVTMKVVAKTATTTTTFALPPPAPIVLPSPQRTHPPRPSPALPVGGGARGGDGDGQWRLDDGNANAHGADAVAVAGGVVIDKLIPYIIIFISTRSKHSDSPWCEPITPPTFVSSQHKKMRSISGLSQITNHKSATATHKHK
jgi:hypothetical protein